MKAWSVPPNDERMTKRPCFWPVYLRAHCLQTACAAYVSNHHIQGIGRNSTDTLARVRRYHNRWTWTVALGSPTVGLAHFCTTVRSSRSHR
jgi:hypothetical protein